MAETPNDGETGAVVPPKNDAPTPPTPAAAVAPEEKKTDDGEIEAARKRAEQAEMRANQLANQLKAKEDAEAATKTKELEEQNKLKDLYEQEKSKREEIERAQETAEQQKELTEAQNNVLGDYPDAVKNIAKTTGLSLGEVSEDAVSGFKAKLDEIQSTLGSAKVTPNNPGTSTPGKQEYTRQEMYEILKDPVKRDEYYRSKGGLTAEMMGAPKK